MSYLFDTDAISEVLRKKPAEQYIAWLRTIPADEQVTTSISVGEMYWGALRSNAAARHISNIEQRVLTALTVIPFDVDAARKFGELKAELEAQGKLLPDADLQIAAIALVGGHELVTGNVAHFSRIPGLRINTALAATRAG